MYILSDSLFTQSIIPQNFKNSAGSLNFGILEGQPFWKS